MPMFSPIAGAIRPPEVEDLTTAFARQASLRAQMQQAQLGAQQLESGTLALAAQKQEDADNVAGRKLFAGAGPEGPTDSQIMTTYGPKVGAAVLKGRLDAQKSHADLTKINGENATAESDYLGSVMKPVADANYDPALFETQLKVLESHGHAGEAKQFRDAAAKDPSHIQGMVDAAVSGSPKQSQLASEAQTSQAREDTAATGKKKADAELPGIKANAELAQHKIDVIKNAKPKDFLPLVDQIAPPDVKGNAALNKRLKAQVSFSLQQGDVEGAKAALSAASAEMGKVEVATNPDIAKVRIDVHNSEAAGKASSSAAGATSGPLTPDDYKRAGAEFAITGVMPALGNGSGPVKQRMIHEKMEFARNSGLGPRDMALAGAAFKGDSKSLAAFQTQRDQIVSAESTANKNLDLFISAASKIPDTGVPWANTPLRMLDQKIVGSENMAAVNAARAVATNEVAKVTAGGGLGGVLSDAAKQEVKEYNPANATFKQTLAVARILKKDMANRHSSMDVTLDAIRGRIGTFGAAPADTAAPASKVEKWGFDSSGKLVKQ